MIIEYKPQWLQEQNRKRRCLLSTSRISTLLHTFRSYLSNYYLTSNCIRCFLLLFVLQRPIKRCIMKKKKKTADVYPVSAAFPTSVAIALFTDDVTGGVSRGMCESRSVRLFRTLVWSAFRYHGTRARDGVSVWQGNQLVWRSSVTAKHVVQNNYSPYHLYADNLVELVSCSLRPHPSLQVTIVSLSQPRHWNFPRITRYQADSFC